MFHKKIKKVYKPYLKDYPKDFLNYLKEMNDKGWKYAGTSLFALKFKETNRRCTYDLEYGVIDEKRKQELEEQNYQLIDSHECSVYCCYDLNPAELEFSDERYKKYLLTKFNGKNVALSLAVLFYVFVINLGFFFELPDYPLSMLFFNIISNYIYFFGLLAGIYALYKLFDQINAILLIRNNTFTIDKRKVFIVLNIIIQNFFVIVFLIQSEDLFLICFSIYLVIFLIACIIENDYIYTGLICVLILFPLALNFIDFDYDIKAKFNASKNDLTSYSLNVDGIYDDFMIFNKFTYVKVNHKFLNNYIIHSYIRECESNNNHYKSYEAILNQYKHGEINGISYLETEDYNYIYKDNELYASSCSIKELIKIYETY